MFWGEQKEKTKKKIKQFELIRCFFSCFDIFPFMQLRHSIKAEFCCEPTNIFHCLLLSPHTHTNAYRFWYISLVACYRDNVTCTWHHFDPRKFRSASKSNATSAERNRHADLDYEITYDIRLVNGNPNRSSSNPLTFQFSFDQQNILEMNLIFLIVYLILVPIQIYAVRIQRHPVTKLFTLSLILEFVSLVFMLGYYIRYTIGGIGSDTVKTIGDILDILSRVSEETESLYIENYIIKTFIVQWEWTKLGY